jgi:hypothetical protein
MSSPSPPLVRRTRALVSPPVLEWLPLCIPLTCPMNGAVQRMARCFHNTGFRFILNAQTWHESHVSSVSHLRHFEFVILLRLKRLFSKHATVAWCRLDRSSKVLPWGLPMYETLTGTPGLKSKVARIPHTSNLPNQASIFKDLQGLSRILINSIVTPLSRLFNQTHFRPSKVRNFGRVSFRKLSI